MTRIGLTGGIAAGKSVVASRLRELGAVVVDHDVIARQVVAPGTVGLGTASARAASASRRCSSVDRSSACIASM